MWDLLPLRPSTIRSSGAQRRAGSASMFNCSTGCSRSLHLLHLRPPAAPPPPSYSTFIPQQHLALISLKHLQIPSKKFDRANNSRFSSFQQRWHYVYEYVVCLNKLCVLVVVSNKFSCYYSNYSMSNATASKQCNTLLTVTSSLLFRQSPTVNAVQ
jgi:hypothetical protein